MLAIATPTMATMLSYTLMQFVDKYYCSRLGPEELAAAGNGGIAAWFPVSVMMGLLGVVNTYVSQNFGAGRPERGPAYAWAGMWMGLGVWLVILVPYGIFLPQVYAAMRDGLNLEHPSARVIELETIYARILIAGMVLTLWARGIAQFFYGMHRPLVVAAGVVAGNLVNWYFTWALVFGKHGFPEWGVAGSAVGTVIGGFVEFAIPMGVFLSSKYRTKFRTLASWRPSVDRIRDIWRIGWPAGLMFGNEMICWWIFMAGLVARFGTEHNAAGWITLQYMHLSFMPAVGMSIAVTAIVGKCVGSGRFDLAVQRVGLATKLTMLYMGVCAASFVLFREPMIRLFASGDHNQWTPEQTEAVIRIGSQLLILAAIFQLFDAIGITLVGALRGAGDTVWPGVMTAIISWGVIIGGGWSLAVFAPGLGSLGPWMAAAAYIILFAILLLWRFRSGAWRSKAVVQPAEMRCPTCSFDLAGLITPSICPECGSSVGRPAALSNEL